MCHSSLERVWLTRRFLSIGSMQKRENGLVERRDPNLKDSIEFVAVCG